MYRLPSAMPSMYDPLANVNTWCENIAKVFVSWLRAVLFVIASIGFSFMLLRRFNESIFKFPLDSSYLTSRIKGYFSIGLPSPYPYLNAKYAAVR